MAKKQNKLRIIKTDLFNISSRIREIDKNYFIAYSFTRHRFEVHNSSQGKDTFCLSVPFSSLDARTLKLVRKSRVERKEDILKEMEVSNEKYIKNELYRLEKSAEYELERKLRGKV